VLSLRARDGTTVRLSPLAVTTVIEEVVGGRRFQVVQTGENAIEIRLSRSEGGKRNADWRAARAALSDFLARQALPNVRLDLGASAPIPDPRSGKWREVLYDVQGETGVRA
jgi:hypothetical protein